MRTCRLLIPIVLVVLLSACGSSNDEVTFTAADASAATGPTRYCDVQVTDCEDNPDATAVLPVPPDVPLEVSVPDSVSEAPWQVVFRYRVGEQTTEGRTAVFSPGQQMDYTLTLPDGAQLQTAEVQQFGAPAPGPEGPEFVIRATWVLSVAGQP